MHALCMMGDIDPESEALIRQLHRELNGLTRSTRPSRGASALERGKPGQGKKGDERRQKTHAEGSGSQGEASSSESEDKPAQKKIKKEGHAEGPKQASPSSQGRAGVSTVHDHLPHVKHKKSSGDKSEAYLLPAAGSGKVKLPAEFEPPMVFKTPHEAAAAASSNLVREKARQSKPVAAGQRMIKCFHAGVRWGITLAPDALKTRADLATILNDAFAGEILSCGRGDILNILFLDGEGHVTEFPSLRISGTRDSSTKWKASVERAVKVYVRR